MAVIDTYSIQEIIETDDPNTLITEAQRLAKQLHNDDSTKTQIRKLFGTLRKIEMIWPTTLEEPGEKQQLEDAYRQLVLFSPRMAYASRNQSSLRSISDTIQEGIKYVKKDDRHTMQRLVQFFEAVVAYYFAGPQVFDRGGRR